MLETSISQGVGRMVLSRPHVLNALDAPMMLKLSAIIQQYQTDPSIKCVMITAHGERAFCAGGDLKPVFEAQTRHDLTFLKELFAHEYVFNYLLQTFSKPYIAFLFGYTMGGGMGASINGSHRIVCDSSVLSMPETGIGFFPDVGASYFLNRCPGEIAMYLGLTGLCIHAEDALYAGLATHYINYSQYDTVQKALLSQAPSTHDEVSHILEGFAQKPTKISHLEENRDAIDTYFKGATLSDIFKALQASAAPFAQETLAILNKRCPMSLHATFEQLRRAKGMSPYDIMRMEYRMSQHFVRMDDFKEGIRAAVIDKDRTPTWTHQSHEDIDLKEVSRFFDLLPGYEDLPIEKV